MMLTKGSCRIGLFSLLILVRSAGAGTLSAQSNPVTVPVLVTEAKGSHVTTLKQEDFQLFEVGRLQPIASFLGPNQPIDIDFIVAINAMKESRATYNAQIVRDSIDKFKQFSNPGNQYTIDELTLGANGLFEAIEGHVEKLSRSSNPRRALIVVANGIDNGGATTARTLANSVRGRQVPIYVRAGGGVCGTNDIVALGNCGESVSIYDEISEYSGGHPIRPWPMKNREDLLLELAEELRDQYVLGFQSAGIPDNKWHNVEVRISNPALAATLKAKTTGRHFLARSR